MQKIQTQRPIHHQWSATLAHKWTSQYSTLQLVTKSISPSGKPLLALPYFLFKPVPATKPREFPEARGHSDVYLTLGANEYRDGTELFYLHVAWP